MRSASPDTPREILIEQSGWSPTAALAMAPTAIGRFMLVFSAKHPMAI
jgi:hypothetical protein